MNALEIRDLTIAFGPNVVFENFALAVERSETIAILGPSGSGKSTLLRAIAGLIRPTAGRIAAAGEIGYVFQEPRLLPWLDVEKNVAFAARNARERARVGELLELVGLGGVRRRLPKELSGGMAQRVALARSLVREPALLLLDEPLAALDALRRLELQRALRALIRRANAAAILVTHDVDEALTIADRVLVLSGHPAHISLETQADPDVRSQLFGALGVVIDDVRDHESRQILASS